jgi:hypothetical protein
MKSLRLLFTVALVALATAAFAQTDTQKSFDQLKALAGTWKGTVVADTPDPNPEWNGKTVWVTLRVTSRGNALVHEMKEPGTPDDTSKDDPITLLYADGDRLFLTHYCDAGNRPHMEATVSPDGKTIAFHTVDVSGGNQYGHMHGATFTLADANHHTEEWTFMEPGNKTLRAHMDLQRVK